MPNKRNYGRETDEIIAGLSGRVPRLLLHVCCAPCSSSVLEYLSQYFEITVLYYNPNISPESEYRLRADEERRFISELRPLHPIVYSEGVYEYDAYLAAVRGLEAEPEGGERCGVCFNMRLRETARLCREGGYDYFTTTLTVSPLKNADKLNAIGEAAAAEYGAVWLPCDFKKKDGYRRSTELSREYGLYRQNYCGCVFSKAGR